MRRLPAFLAAMCVIAAPAFAQTPKPPVVGETVSAFEMVPDRTVIFEPVADGQLKIVKVTENDGHAPMPRNPGQVAVAMNYALEIGTMMEFNSGLDYGFSYAAMVMKADDREPSRITLLPIESCPVNGQSVGSDQWPQPYPRIAIARFARKDGPAACEPG